MGTRESAGLAGRALPAAVLTGGLVFAYLRSFGSYGLNIEDEGTLLYQIVRTARGELPYVDFSTGYTPGFFALNAWLWRMAGDVVTFRTIIVATHAATAAGLAFLLACVARPSLALVFPWLYVSFIPVYPGEFCAFNIPYPAWFATVGWIATALCMVGYLRRGGRSWLMGAGAAAAFTLAMKPNAGVFAVAAAVAVLLLVREPARGAGSGSVVLWATLWVGIVGGVWVVFGLTRVPVELVVFVLPVVAAMAALITGSRVRRPALVGDVASVLVPYLLLSLPWMLFFLFRLGVDGFGREVLLLGSNAAALFYVVYPGFERWGVAVTALAIAFSVAGWFVAARRLPPRTSILAVAAMLAAVGLTIPWFGLLPEGLVWSVIWQLQSAGFALTLAAHAAGVVWLWFRGRRPTNVLPATLLLFGVFMHLQLYPRTDFMHLLMAAPLTLVFAGYLLERVYDAWERGFAAVDAPRLGRVVSGATTLVLVGAVLLAATPARTALAPGERFELPVAAVPIGLEAAAAGELRALAAAAADLRRLAPAGAASLGFPAASAVLLLSETVSPVPHDYFFPGRPDHQQEAEMLDRLAADPPAALVALNGYFTFFDAAPAYYYLLRRFARDNYTLAARHGRYDVLVRRDVDAEPGAETGRAPLPAALVAYEGRGPVLADSAAALLYAATSRDAVVRRAAVRLMLDALGGDTDPGLEHYVQTAKLDRRQRVLLLRALRDLRDPRASSHLFAEIAVDDPRIVRDALGAMHVTRAQMIARRHLWSGAFETSAFPGRAGLRAAVRQTLADASAPPRAVAYAAELARALRDAGSVPALRDRWRAAMRRAVAPPGDQLVPPTGPETVASVAAALMELAPMDVVCDLAPLLARARPPILEIVPTLLLQLARQDGAVGVRARRCLGEVLAVPGPAQAEALWVAAALGASEMLPAIVDAVETGDAGARQAALWALGEAPPSAAVRGLLARMAADAPEPVTRRVAEAALAKHDARR